MTKSSNAKYVVLGLNILMIVALCVINVFYQANDFNYTLKIIGSGCFVVQGLINFVYAMTIGASNKKFFLFMMAGLIFAMAGDIAINLNFVAGAGLFAVGHIWFVIAFCCIQRLNILEFAISIGTFLAVGAFLLFFPLLQFNPEAMRWVCIGYAAIISFMLGNAWANFIREPSVMHFIFAIGSLSFCVSDFMLMLNSFVGLWPWTRYVCMATYYPALSLFALGVFWKIFEELQKKKKLAR